MLLKTEFKYILSFILAITAFHAYGQGNIAGILMGKQNPLAYATISLSNTSFGTTTNEKGEFQIQQIPLGTYELVASYVGYESVNKIITLDEESPNIELQFTLKESNFIFDQVVVTGTKTFKRQTNSPVIVNVMNSEMLDNVQACNLSEGLKFQPGLRVENDCQTCNYTQLRMNGLAGGYSQILINGRPIFSPLTGLYGLEQLPVNMIDRIEIVRGGGSSLYGSSAIGGTVNVLTKIPKKNFYELGYTYQNINGQTSDHQINGNASIVSKHKKAGVSLFGSHRNRDFYDHNDDQFSEIPLIENTSLGANFFLLPADNQKLELSISNLNEYRFGGEMKTEIDAHLTQQAEERTHHVWMASADYQINFNQDQTSLITYLAWQHTDRDHYTGILPDEPADIENHLANPPYGISTTKTIQGGLQLNHQIDNFLKGRNIFTFGTEYLVDDVYDEIPAYNYLIDQTTKDLGLFLQSDWEIVSNLSLLSGIRMDIHNLVDQPIFSPRLSLFYKYKDNTQFRLNYGTGFRAPQAFDTDLHIAFAGGGISRVLLSPGLLPERSNSLSASINYDKVSDSFVAGFTLEGFYTRLDKAFFLQPIGEDAFGELFEKRNGQGARVQGITVELRANYNRKAQLEGGFTIQSSRFDDPVQYIDELVGIRDFIRTPNQYGFASLSLTPSPSLNMNINYTFTGSMKVPHFAGALNQNIDEIIDSKSFHEVNLKLGYTLPLLKSNTQIEIFGGTKNLFNAYQNDFDIGKNRDSNFVYGPGAPRTYFVGLKLNSK